MEEKPHKLQWHRKHLNERGKNLWSQHSGSMLFLAIATLVCGACSLVIEVAADKMGWTPHGIQNPGTIFALITGIVTVFGFWFTIEALHEVQGGIHSFEAMVKRVHSLLETTEKGDTVRLLVKTPTTGCLVFSKPEAWKALPDLILKLPRERGFAVKIITLGHAEMMQWYNNYDEIRETKPARLKIAFDQTKEYLNELAKWAEAAHANGLEIEKAEIAVGRATQSLDSSDAKSKRNAEAVLTDLKTRHDELEAKQQDLLQTQSKFLLWTEMPGYYAFCNSKKAIFVLPLFMPTVGTGRPSGAPENRTDMIGFESSQFSVVEAARDSFEYYWSVSTNLKTEQSSMEWIEKTKASAPA